MVGKIVATTFHQSKGLERPIVVVMNFSAAYYRYGDKDADTMVLTPALYVAATRAKRQLWLMAEDLAGNHLQWMARRSLEDLSRASLTPDRRPPVLIKRFDQVRAGEGGASALRAACELSWRICGL